MVWVLRFGNYEMNQPSWQPLLTFLNDPNTDWSQVHYWYSEHPSIVEGTNKVKLPPNLEAWLQNYSRELYAFISWFSWPN